MPPEELFATQRWVAGVVGLGYVGLPLAVGAVERGLDVLGFDVNTDKVRSLAGGVSDIDDVSADSLKRALDIGLDVTTDATRLTECDAVFICVPSPLGRSRQPDLSYIEAASEAVAANLKPGALVSLESTSYPGTTEDVVVGALERHGWQVDEDVFVCFSSERVNPGHDTPLSKIPKVVGGVSERSSALAAVVYSRLVDEVHLVSSSRVAEMSKLVENTYRAVNIALANEIAILCHQLGINVWEVIDAAASKPFGFQAFYPGPGVGGHCIPLDPHYLSWRAKDIGFSIRFIELADLINASMPTYTVARLTDILNEHNLPVRGARVLGVGLSYKPNISDDRESPSVIVLQQLQRKGAEVSVWDPVVGKSSIDRHGFRVADLDGDYDAAVILTDHDDVDYRHLTKRARVVFDTRGAMRRRGIEADNIIPL